MCFNKSFIKFCLFFLLIFGNKLFAQNIEIYKGKPIFYSLGNFVFDGFDTLDENTGWVLQMTIKQDNKIAWQIFEARLDKNGIPKNYGVIQRQE